MNPDKLRVKIAEVCGWDDCVDGWGIDPFGRAYERVPLPNFLEDLNACHEMRKVLTPDQQCHYIDHLEAIIRRPYNVAFGDKPDRKFPLNHFGRFAVADAEAIQHCEAFARTLGFWEECQ